MISLLLALTLTARGEQPPPDYRAALLAAAEDEADALIAQGELEQALALVRDVRAQVVDDARLTYEEGLILNLMGETAKAEARYRDALAQDPGLASAWYDLGGILLGRGETEEARAAFQAASEGSASHPKGWAAPLQLALMSARDRDAEAMERWLREGLRRGLRFADIAPHPEWTEIRRDPELGLVLERLATVYGEEPLLETWR